MFLGEITGGLDTGVGFGLDIPDIGLPVEGHSGVTKTDVVGSWNIVSSLKGLFGF